MVDNAILSAQAAGVRVGVFDGRAKTSDRGALRGSRDTDEDLIARAGEGDRLAASELVLRHTDKIMGACYRMLGERSAAEDAAQETFLRLWKHAGKWRNEGAKFETWLYRVAMNVCLDRLRKRGREAPEEAAPEQVDHGPRADALLIEEERRAMIETALARLPDRQRLAITLCHYQELSNIEAAKIMETSVEAVESLLSRARRALRERLLSARDELLEGRVS
ncbi:MAG: RNA polymerase sigma factor [Pseudomonadota bacterium]